MSSRLLKSSICVNLILLVVAAVFSGKNGRSALSSSSDDRAASSSEFSTPATTSSLSTPSSLRWSNLESDDYPTYIANLRKTGCPEPVLRRIINSDLRDLYAKKAFALVHEFHREFWEIAARQNVQQYYDKTLAPQVKALCNEPDALLKELLGEAPPETPNSPATKSSVNRYTNFLSPQKQEQLRQLDERYGPQLQSFQRADLSEDQQPAELTQLRDDIDRERAKILSPDELAEYHLRQTTAAAEVQQFYGIDFSETEMRNLAKALNDYHHRPKNEEGVERETLDQQLQAALGPERFNDLTRSRAATYRELYDIVTDFGQPAETATQIFDLRLSSEKQSDEIRAASNRSPEEKQALLDDLQEHVEQSARNKMGAAAFETYKSAHGGWINGLGRL